MLPRDETAFFIDAIPFSHAEFRLREIHPSIPQSLLFHKSRRHRSALRERVFRHAGFLLQFSLLHEAGFFRIPFLLKRKPHGRSVLFSPDLLQGKRADRKADFCLLPARDELLWDRCRRCRCKHSSVRRQRLRSAVSGFCIVQRQSVLQTCSFMRLYYRELMKRSNALLPSSFLLNTPASSRTPANTMPVSFSMISLILDSFRSS